MEVAFSMQFLNLVDSSEETEEEEWLVSRASLLQCWAIPPIILNMKACWTSAEGAYIYL